MTVIPTSKIRVHSSGGVVFRKADGVIQVALIRIRGFDLWQLPKGKLEPGESREDAALREVQEETGLVTELVKELGEVSYSFTGDYGDGPREYQKTVTFFLLNCVGGDTALHDSEAEDVEWFPVEAVIGNMRFESEIDIMNSAIRILRKMNRG